MNQNRAWGIGFIVWGAIVACTPSIRDLGDEPTAGSGGGGKGGSGSVLPKAGSGSTPTPSDGGAPDNAAGTPNGPEECFSPSQNPELAQQDGALGCACNATDPVCVSDLTSDPPWYGMLECEDGRWKSVPPSCDRDCFSPTNSPHLAVDPTAGCACDDDPPECVQTVLDGQPWRIGMYCEEGKWTTGEDGVCGFGDEADCRVGGVTYAHGARRVPSPFSRCNTCDCSEGELVNCTMYKCSGTICDEGSFPASRCVECGPADECLEVEIGCLSGPECETGSCSEGRCG
jgi:hypothetical protein